MRIRPAILSAILLLSSTLAHGQQVLSKDALVVEFSKLPLKVGAQVVKTSRLSVSIVNTTDPKPSIDVNQLGGAHWIDNSRSIRKQFGKRTAKILAIDGTRATKLKIRFDEESHVTTEKFLPNVRARVVDHLEDFPHIGNEYVFERTKNGDRVTELSGKPVKKWLGEYLIGRELNGEALSAWSPLAFFLDKKSRLKVGETIKSVYSDFWSFPILSSLRLQNKTPFLWKLTGIQNVNGVKCGVFETSYEFKSTPKIGTKSKKILDQTLIELGVTFLVGVDDSRVHIARAETKYSATYQGGSLTAPVTKHTRMSWTYEVEMSYSGD